MWTKGSPRKLYMRAVKSVESRSALTWKELGILHKEEGVMSQKDSLRYAGKRRLQEQQDPLGRARIQLRTIAERNIQWKGWECWKLFLPWKSNSRQHSEKYGMEGAVGNKGEKRTEDNEHEDPGEVRWVEALTSWAEKHPEPVDCIKEIIKT